MATLQYDFSVVGYEKVASVLATLEKRFEQHNARIQRSVKRVGATARGESQRHAARGSVSVPVEDTRKAAIESKKALAEKARVERAAERAKLQAERQVAKEKLQASRKVAAEEKAASRVRLAEERERVRYRTMLNTVGLREMRTEQRGRERSDMLLQRAAAREAHQRATFVRHTLGNSAERVSGTLKAVGTTGAAMLGVGGAAIAASAVGGAARLDEAVRRLVISGTKPGQAAETTPDELRKQIVQTGIATGQNPEDVVSGVQQYVTKVGDIKTAIANMRVFSEVSQATGASISDIASAAADLSEKFDVKAPQDMAQALAVLTAQGKKGAFELRDLASYLPEMAAAAASFGIKGVEGTTKLGGMAQIARQATGSGAEAATSIQAMFRQLSAKSEKMQSGEAFGGRKVQVFESSAAHPEGDPTKPLRDFGEILGDIMVASHGNLVQLQEVFDVRGIRAVNPLISKFREASEKAGGGEAGAASGRAAVIEQLNTSANVVTNYKDIQADASSAMKSYNVQMAIFNAKIKDAIASQIFPTLAELAPRLQELVPYVGQAVKAFVSLVKWVSDHPGTSIAMLIGGQLIADFTRARLGALVGSLIEKAFTQRRVATAMSTATGAVAGGGGVGGGMAATVLGTRTASAMAGSNLGGAALNGLAAGVPIAAAIFSGGVASYELSEARMKASGAKLNTMREMSADNMTADSMKQARDIVQEQRLNVENLNKPSMWEGGISGALEGVGDLAALPFQPILDLLGISKSVNEGIKSFAGSEGKMVGGALENTFQPNNRVDRDFQTRTLDEMEKKLTLLESAAKSQQVAADKLSGVADKMGDSLNRGPAPSPVKG